MKVRTTVAKKIPTDRTPCEIKSITFTKVKPIDPSEIYGLQKWEWLKESIAANVVCSLNAFSIRCDVETGCLGKVNRALAGMPRDSGGLFKAKASIVGQPNKDTDTLEIVVDWADEKAKQAWDDNSQSMRKAQPRFRFRRPELVKHATARNLIRQKHLLKKRKKRLS